MLYIVAKLQHSYPFQFVCPKKNMHVHHKLPPSIITTGCDHVFSAGDTSDKESDKPPADGSGDKKSNKSKMEKLEARVQELAAREGELMEQIYAMKLENQVNY